MVKKKLILNRIKEVLQEQGRTQTWLAEQINKSFVVVTNYCNNNTQPSLEVLFNIAKVLDVDVCELLVKSK
jgi:putative transcriptional regulator